MKTPLDAFADKHAPNKQGIYLEIESIGNRYRLTFTDGNSLELPSLKACEKIIDHFQKRAQFGNRPFTLYDCNTKTEWNDFRIYTDYLKACHDRIKGIALIRKHRMCGRKYYPRKVKKIDSKVLRPYERTW
jgi:hypothetical protein